MSIVAGTRIGAYEVIAKLGEGGMGAVYRARDTKLKREVAIKVLPADVAGDGARLARFQREAEVLAALNHPHIAGIYGLEDAGGTIALVMELVEGDDLSQRIARGPIPFDEALPIARQIAEALETAHEQGIVHRDLKPANIKVRPDGTVKVLDFGLAKALDTNPASATAGNSPTITSPAMTQAGMILGTAAYMAPEQAKGRPVDKRADIWAFGAVLYEMLTGRRAFEGEDIADVLSRVLQREPDLAALPAATPSRVRELIARCLVKDPRRRLRDMGDARLDLESAIAAPLPDAAALATTQGSRGGYQLAWAVAGAAVLAAGSFAALWLGAARAPAVARQARVEIVTPATTDPGSIALSPDGQQIAYIAADGAESMLWLRVLATGQAHVVKGTAGATLPFWSSDSRFIAFFAAGMLKRVDLEGTTVADIGPAPRPRGGTWHPEGGILYASSSVGPIWHVDPAGRTGQPRKPITELGQGQTGHLQPDWLPDGQHFVYTSSGTTDARGIWLGSTDGSPARRLVDADMARVLPPSTLLFVRQNTLLAQPLAAASATLEGEPLVVAPLEGGPLVDGGLSISAHGSIAWRAGGRQQARYQWVDRSGRAEAPDGGADEDMDGARSAMPSPDGRFLAVDRNVDGNSDIWIKDLARGVLMRLTVHADFDRFPTWTPDGKTIVFASTRDRARWDLYARAAGGSGEDERLLSTPRTKHPLEFSADGRLLLYEEWAQASEPALWTLQMSDRKPSALVSGARRGTFSPDGRWLAYESAASGRSEIYVQPYPGPGDRVQVSRDGGVQARWRGDGRELYFVGLDRQLMAVPVGVPGDGSAVELGGPVPLFLTPLDVATGDRAEYLTSPDGQRFLVRAVPGDGPQAPIHVILHWRPSPP